MFTSKKKLWIGIGILILLSPLGVLVPQWFGAGGAWGEWGLDEIERMTGFVPEGMKGIASLWKAPLPDYALPGQGEGGIVRSLGYLLSALIGIGITAGVMYLLAKMLGKNNDVNKQ